MKLYFPLLAGFFMLSACAVQEELTPAQVNALETAAKLYVKQKFPDWSPEDALTIPDEYRLEAELICSIAPAFAEPDVAPVATKLCRALLPGGTDETDG